ncbi:glycosyltransferase family 31 protein [Aaosphaeria arxii CBS 175.79]|uniref:Glycosyltransferase family 31 protein n=1 Tax=Aaosphaeria arxii CBS 175.79 TaxID=1450172 RepID=A0A6A5XBB2_9PLEO|nr:glycosyltransferase family 31 protein [Aaosphaeria arxii CBS 175.79]KAF2010193.1 glycosyltransferase family 31 protein [Aaosphaeria arxii CBS 175.79]
MHSARSGRLRLATKLAALAAAIYGFIWVSGFPRYYDEDELPPTQQRGDDPVQTTPFPVEFDHVVVSLKTSATNAYKEVPPLLVLTKQMYYDSLLLMSDLRMDIGAFHIEDVLDRYKKDFVDNTPELERYKHLDYCNRAKIPFDTIKDGDPQKEKEIQEGMDRYMILRIVQRAWELRPERLWYVFGDAQTYIARANLQTWLGQFDHSKPYFFANPPIAGLPDPFAVGGHTFILSATAMRALFVEQEKVLDHWNDRISKSSTAYDVLTDFLSTEISLEVNQTWPAISGFNPLTAPYGNGFWCEVIVAMDNVPPESLSELWRLDTDHFEGRLGSVQDPVTFADLWRRFMQGEDLDTPRPNWDNLSSDPDNAQFNILSETVNTRSHAKEHMLNNHHHHTRDEEDQSVDTWEACQEACNANDLCVQWSYSTVPTSNYNSNGDTRCHLSRNMRMGRHTPPSNTVIEGQPYETRWKSGWRKEKFEQFAQHHRCKGQQDKM